MTTKQATQPPEKPLLVSSTFFALFLCLGLWQSLIVPFFQGPDEQVHYATVQHWTEPKEKSWPMKKGAIPGQSDDIRTWHFSEEVRETAHRLEFDSIKWQTENTQSFESDSRFGTIEKTIIENDWGRFIDTEPVNASGTWSLYYFFSSKIESWLSEYPILDRILAMRAFSLLIGTLTLILAYLTVRKIGWGQISSLAFSSLIAFQPMFLATATIVNIDIALVFSFTLFFLGAVYWIIDGPSLARSVFLIASVIIGFYSKGPGVVLFGLLLLLFGWSFYRRFSDIFKKRISLSIFGCAAIGLAFLSALPSSVTNNFFYLDAHSVFPSATESISVYIEKTISWSAFEWTSLSYWGNFGWLDASIQEFVLQAILGIEVLALFGLIWLFASKDQLSFLPNKRILVFAFISIIVLQFAIRFFDWRVFDTTGKIIIGTPGRYFLPNVLSHMLLVVSGLGYWLGTKEHFRSLLQILATLMFLLTFYCTWFIILPRYYL